MSHVNDPKPRLLPARSVALAILQRLIAYHEGDAEALESLADLLQGQRVASASVREALGLLADGLAPDSEEVALSAEPRDPRRRVLTEQERDTLTQEAQGYLMRLAADGRIGAGEMEDVLARLSDVEEPIGLSEIQELVWQVTMGRETNELSYEADRYLH